MKKVLLFLMCFYLSAMATAQIGRWLVGPISDSVYLFPGSDFIVVDSMDEKLIIESNGKLVCRTSADLNRFYEDFAVMTDSMSISSIININGNVKTIPGIYDVTYDNPYFSEGYLLVKERNAKYNRYWNISSDRYLFLDTNASPIYWDECAKIFPFSKGLSACIKYVSEEKMSRPYFQYKSKDTNEIVLNLENGKPLKWKDVKFASTVNQDGVGLVVVSDELYTINISHDQVGLHVFTLTPVKYRIKGSNREKTVYVDIEEVFELLNDLSDNIDTLSFNAYVDGRKIYELYFNKCLMLSHVISEDDMVVYNNAHRWDVCSYSSRLKSSKKSEKWGLMRDDKCIVPHQFDSISFCIDQTAVVKVNDLWGVLMYDENVKYSIKLHEGKDLPFRHKELESTIQVELPQEIKANLCDLYTTPTSGIKLDLYSIESKNTDYGNYLKYQCKLMIKDDLPDVVTPVSYNVQLVCDGILQPEYLVEANAWHYKYRNVDWDKSETKVEKGSLVLVLNILEDKVLGDKEYPFNISVEYDSVKLNLEKISETRYRCKIDSLKIGNNTFEVSLAEEGCPITIFPFDVYYEQKVIVEENKDDGEGEVMQKIEEIIDIEKVSVSPTPREKKSKSEGKKVEKENGSGVLIPLW